MESTGETAPYRDALARTRTELANERTVLSYGRTALACVAAGAGTLELFEGRFVVLIAAALIIGGIGIAVVGILRFGSVRRRLKEVSKATRPAGDAP